MIFFSYLGMPCLKKCVKILLLTGILDKGASQIMNLDDFWRVSMNSHAIEFGVYIYKYDI